jgi:myo-inositol-1-phosphate synthase
MTNGQPKGPIRVVIAGLGNCASSLIEGIQYYRQNPETQAGLLFPLLAGYSVRDIEVVGAFDISARKVGLPVCDAMYQAPNNFVRIPGVQVASRAPVWRGPTLDGNPEHLRRFVPESDTVPVDVVASLKDITAEVLVNLLPTGSLEATVFYARAALEAGCAFINCIPSILAQDAGLQKAFAARNLPLMGDDIKSQLGTTILHRSLLQMLELRGATLAETSQVNIGGNTDFANFVYRAESKLVSKRKSLHRYVDGVPFHVGHHYDPTRGPWKNAYIEIGAMVFGGSLVKISVKLESDDKPNSAGSVVDLIRIAKGALDLHLGGVIPEACAFYMKSPPIAMEESEAIAQIERNWNGQVESKPVNEVFPRAAG